MSLRVPEDQPLPDNPTFSNENRSIKMSFKRKRSLSESCIPHASLNTIRERGGTTDDNVAPNDLVEIRIVYEPSQPRPINSLVPTHNFWNESPPSISSRPPLPTPRPSKGTASNATTPPSPTPVAQVRTSQWYDKIEMMLRPVANRRYSSRSMEESSGHYVNDGMGPLAALNITGISPP